MPSEADIAKLALIRYLYQQGEDLSRQYDPLASLSILSFHDSIELFLDLACYYCKADISDTKKQKTDFAKCLEALKNQGVDLRLHSQALDDINNLRVQLKHHGATFSKDTISVCRIKTRDFLENAVSSIFNINFSEISLVLLIQNQGAKDFLKTAEQEYIKDNIDRCSYLLSCAFEELLEAYLEQRKFLKWRAPILGYSKDTDEKVKKFANEVHWALTRLKDITLIVGLGMDYEQYMIFSSFVPSIYYEESIGAYIENHFNTEDDVIFPTPHEMDDLAYRFCFDFVVNTGLKLQQHQDYQWPEHYFFR